MSLNEIYQKKKHFKNSRAIDCGYRSPSNNNLKKHAEKVHKKEKLQNTLVVASVIQKSNSGTNYIFCALMQQLISSEVFVWISACLRFHKKIF